MRIFGLFLRIGDQAVAAVLAAVDDRKGIRVFAVEEGIELMLQQVHLQDGLLRRHRLDGEALGADDGEIAAFLFFVHGADTGIRPLDRAGLELLLKTGLVLADLALDGRQAESMDANISPVVSLTR
mgnify:CR=1 FL=1